MDRAPLHPRDAEWRTGSGAHVGHPLHADFGTTYAGTYNGIPINVVGNSTPRRIVSYHQPNYAGESDPMPVGGLPIPDDVKIEGDMVTGDPHAWADPGADHHMILWDTDRNELHELYSIRVEADGTYSTGAYARWDLTSNALRPNGWTSADVAGLPIAPLLVRYDEAASGEIKHAIRFCLDLSKGQTWPARHPGTSGGDQNPPMGSRVRLRGDVDIRYYYGTGTGPDSVTSPPIRAILKCMQEYGMILADHAGDWFFEGEPDPRWNNDALHALVYFPPTLFEWVDGDALMIDPDSGAAHQF